MASYSRAGSAKGVLDSFAWHCGIANMQVRAESAVHNILGQKLFKVLQGSSAIVKWRPAKSNTIRVTSAVRLTQLADAEATLLKHKSGT